MEGRAVQKYVRISPKKVRQVIDLVRRRGVPEAYAFLDFLPKAASLPVKKAIKSAVANVQTTAGTTSLKEETLFIKEARVDAGPTLRRYRARAMGRATMIRKRTSSIIIVVAEKEE